MLWSTTFRENWVQNIMLLGYQHNLLYLTNNTFVDLLNPICTHMMTSSNGNIFRVTGLSCGEFTGHRWIPHTKASDAELWYFLICAWINGWINNREVGDLRRNRANYNVTVIQSMTGNIYRRCQANGSWERNLTFGFGTCFVQTLRWRHMNIMASQITTTRPFV